MSRRGAGKTEKRGEMKRADLGHHPEIELMRRVRKKEDAG